MGPIWSYERARHSRRINFSQSMEQSINHLIDTCWIVDRTYQCMSALCNSQLSSPALGDYLRLCALRTQCCAERWQTFQIFRGGMLDLIDLKPLWQLSDNVESGGLETFLQQSLKMEEKLEELLCHIHKLSITEGDVVTKEFVEFRFLNKQTRMINWTERLIKNLHDSSNGWLFDRFHLASIVHIVYNRSMNEYIYNVQTDKDTCDELRQFIKTLIYCSLKRLQLTSVVNETIDFDCMTDFFNI